ncbi:MAG: HlyD family efflux transporter periplasmic adaptor subunit [Planctomycetales bacterium]
MSSALTPSTKRPIPLEMRRDLAFQEVSCQGRGYWVVKDPVSLTYYQLQPEQHCVLHLLDGRRNLEELRDDLIDAFPFARPTLTDIQSTVIDLHGKRLVRGNRFGQGVALYQAAKKRRREKIVAALKNILYIRLPGWDPEQTLRWLHPFVRWMFEPWAVVLAVTLVLAAWSLLAIQFDTFMQRVPEFKQFFGWPNLVFLWLTLAATKIIHELGHGITCRHYGGECHQIGLIFLVFSPTLYCDVSDSWMLPNKWQRIIIGGGGMYIESIISSLALFGWWFTQPGMLNHLLLNVFFVSSVTTVIFNLNPLMRYDGYYMLSDLLEIPNLSRKAQRLLQETFAWYCLGIRPHPDPFMPAEGRFWFVVYAAASTIYRWVVLFGITLFLYVVLKPYDLQSIGITMAVLSLVGVVFSLVQGVVQTVRAPRQDPLSKPKMAVSGTIVLGLLLAALWIPFPWHLEAAFYIEPHDVQHVYAVAGGRLEEWYVTPGQSVVGGTNLARLVDADKVIRRQELQTELESAQVEFKTLTQLRDFAGAALARERSEAAQRLIEDYEEQIARLRIIAPIDGVIVEAPRVPEPKLSPARLELGNWHGSPFDAWNLGSYLEPGTHLLSIAPDNRFQAILLVDQGDRADLEVGQSLEIKFDHLPDRTYPGEVASISEAHVEYAPASLSNKQGGELPTVTDPRGRERLTSRAYQALVVLEGDTHLLKSGLRGRSRFLVGHRSAANWLWRAFRRTFHFRL